jgi:DNA-binding response OmpR family regulator
MVGFALKRLLEARGAVQAFTAVSADDAEAEIARGGVQAMILDFHLDGMRGDAFFYRACEMQPSIADRTLFITGDPSPQANDAITSTGRPMLVKPFLVSELIDALHLMFAAATPRIARTA